VQQHGGLSGPRTADDHQAFAQPQDLVQGDVALALFANDAIALRIPLANGLALRPEAIPPVTEMGHRPGSQRDIGRLQGQQHHGGAAGPLDTPQLDALCARPPPAQVAGDLIGDLLFGELSPCDDMVVGDDLRARYDGAGVALDLDGALPERVATVLSDRPRAVQARLPCGFHQLRGPPLERLDKVPDITTACHSVRSQLVLERPKARQILPVGAAGADLCILEIGEDEGLARGPELPKGGLELLLGVLPHLGKEQHNEEVALADGLIVLVLKPGL
jgi:hypothetical protein